MSIRRKNLAFRYMWTAWLNLIRWLALLCLVVFSVMAAVTDNPAWLLPMGLAGGTFLLTALLFIMEGPAVRCLGCGGTLLRAMRCTKHSSARRVLGSYTLYCTLALASYARSVHCPYCGMRYRVSASTRAEKRREEEQLAEEQRQEAAARHEEERTKAEARNKPYY